MFTISQIFSQANQIIYDGLYYVNSQLFSIPSHRYPEHKFPRDKFITEMTSSEKQLFVDILTRQWDLWPEMSFEDRCFFVADWITPDIYRASWDDYETIPTESFIEWVEYARKQNLISEDLEEKLISKAEVYCREVMLERQRQEFYPKYKHIIRLKKAPTDKVSIEAVNRAYRKIPKIHRIGIKKDIDSENEISLSKIVLLSWFTFLRSGLLQTKIYFPGDPNKPLDQSQINMPQTLATIQNFSSGFFDFIVNIATNIEAMLIKTLPMVSAETVVDHQNKVFRVFPEFINGTTAYDPQIEKKVHSIIQELHETIFPYLKAKDIPKLVIVGENHIYSLPVKIILLNYLKQLQLNHQKFKNIVIVHEGYYTGDNDEGEPLKIIANVLSEHSKPFTINGITYNWTTSDLFQESCFDVNSSDKFDRAGKCSLVTISSLGLDLKIVDHSGEPTRAEAIETNYYNEHYPKKLIIYEPLYGKKYVYTPWPKTRFQAFDKRLVTKSLSIVAENTADLFVLIIGSDHLKSVTNAFKEAGINSIQLNLNINPGSIKMREALSSRCIKSTANYYSSKIILKGFSHILENKPYNPKECDRYLHSLVAYFLKLETHKLPAGKGFEHFSENALLSSKTQLFLPKKSIEFLKQAMQSDNHADDNTEVTSEELKKSTQMIL